MTETFRGAILAVPPGQLEAGQAFGMSRWQVFREILLPQTIRYALPGFGNNWLVLLKTTALLSVLGLDDVLRKASLAAGATRQPFTFYLAAALDLPAADHGLDRAARPGPSAGPSGPTCGRPMDFSIIASNLGLYFQGLWTTVWLVAAALVLGCCLVGPAGGPPHLAQPAAQLAGLGLHLFLPWHAAAGPAVPDLLRARPVRGGPEQLACGRCCRQAWFCCLLAFTLNTAAYTTEILRGAIEVTPSGEIEAAKAAGMSPMLMLRRIILPSAFRRALPGLRQRGDLHAARQCRGQRGDARRSHRRRAAGAVAYLRPLRGVHHRRLCSTWS